MTTANTRSYASESDRATLSDVKRDAIALKDDATSYIAGSANAGVDAVKKSASNAIDQGKKAVVKGEELMKSACDYVGERPVMSVVIAMAIGAIVGRLLFSRR